MAPSRAHNMLRWNVVYFSLSLLPQRDSYFFFSFWKAIKIPPERKEREREKKNNKMLVIFILLQIEEAHTHNSRWGRFLSVSRNGLLLSVRFIFDIPFVCASVCVSLSLSNINSMKKRVIPGIYTAANIIQPNYTMMIEQNYSFFFLHRRRNNKSTRILAEYNFLHVYGTCLQAFLFYDHEEFQSQKVYSPLSRWRSS